jgi:hypothetical protein
MADKTPKPDYLTEVPEHQLKKLIEKTLAYREEHRKKRVRYPDPTVPEQLTTEAILGLGFFEHDDISDVIAESFRGKRRRGRGRRGGRRGGSGKPSKGGSGGSGKPSKGGRGTHSLPNPNTAYTEIDKALTDAGLSASTKPSGHKARWAEWNLENCDDSKVRWLAKVYQRVFECPHLVWLVEVSQSAVTELEKQTGLKGICGTENTRFQAVGFLVDTNRYDILSQEEWHEVASVQGIPDLRPALRLKLKDKVTGVTFNVVVVHLKSMRGGPKVTEPVRRKQFQLIANRIGTPVKGCKPRVGDYRLVQQFKNIVLGRSVSDHGILFVDVQFPEDLTLVDGMWVVAGDCNDFLDKTTVSQPLTSIGVKLVYPNDSTSTQSMGGRLDGFFRDLPDGACGTAAGEFADDSTESTTVTTGNNSTTSSGFGNGTGDSTSSLRIGGIPPIIVEGAVDTRRGARRRR